MRLLAIGDIHGHLDKLKKLIEIVAPTQDDQIVFVGDYIDRGPDSPGVIQFLIDFGKKFPKTVFLGGNHEHLLAIELCNNKLLPMPKDTLVGAVRGIENYHCIGDIPPFDIHFHNTFIQCGGMLTVEKGYGGFERIPKEHVDFVANCKLYHEEIVGQNSYFFVHAGILPGHSLENQKPEHMLWIRDTFYRYPQFAGPNTDFGFGGRIIIHGHDPHLGVQAMTAHRINVDSGVYLDPTTYKGCGLLTCCNVLTREILQA